MTEARTVKVRGVKSPKGAKLLMMGATGATYIYPDKPQQVLKLPFRDEDCFKHFEIEKRIYRRLGTHPNIINCLQIDDDAIFLERAEHGCIRLYYNNGGTATLEERIKWSRDLANAVQYLHNKNVRQGDIGGRNILLDVNRNIRLCDFAGSAIDNVRASVVAQDGFRHPDRDEALTPTIRGEIHALGSTIFELVTFSCPHQQEEAEEWGMAGELIRQGKYPDVTHVVLGDIIAKCWRGEYISAKEVADAINDKVRAIFNFKQCLFL
jgi:serine/threonine protein kinase